MKVFKFIIRFLLSVILAISIVCIGLWLTGNSHLIKAVRSTYLVGKTGPTIDDYEKFENRVVSAGKVQRWERERASYELEGNLLEETEKWETTSLLIIKDRKLIFEKYWNGYSEKSKTNTFSMAKSFTSLCIGAAIMEGKISSVNEKVGLYLDEFSDSDLTIKDLLTMSSGIDFGESYGDPFGFMAKTYYGTDLYDLTLSKKIKVEPGTQWKYQGGNTLLLSFILQKATGSTLSNYFSEKFWKPVGAERDALWSLDDKEGLERSYCCFYSNARDFAKIGQLMLDSGKWNGKQLISSEFFAQSVSPVNLPNEDGKNIDYYGYQWWLGDYAGVPFYYARGIQGQYIVSIPEWNAVVVRLGHKRDPTRNVKIPSDLYTYLEICKKAVSSFN